MTTPREGHDKSLAAEKMEAEVREAIDTGPRSGA